MWRENSLKVGTNVYYLICHYKIRVRNAYNDVCNLVHICNASYTLTDSSLHTYVHTYISGIEPVPHLNIAGFFLEYIKEIEMF